MRRAVRSAADAAYQQRRDENTVSVTLPVPPSVNGLTSNVSRAKRIKSPAYEKWLRAAGQMLELQRPGRIPGRYALTLTVQRGATRADLGNLEKAVSDLLVTHGVIKDDRHAELITLMWGCVPEGARVDLAWVPAVGTSQPQEAA